MPESYTAIKLSGADRTIGLSAQELTFPVTTPLPPWAHEVNAQLVYHGKLGNEADAVAVGRMPLDISPLKMQISLPDSGAYAAISGTDKFTRLKCNITNGATLSGGRFELLLLHRIAKADQFQGVDPGTTPDDASTFKTIRAPDDNGVSNLAAGETAELSFDLSLTPIPLTATDLLVFVMYKKNLADTDDKALAVGYQDISEPTPIDVYNNTDKACLNGKWYDAGSDDAMAIADKDRDGYAELADIFQHRIGNIYYQPGDDEADSSTYLLASAQPLEPGSGQRLGYILTDNNFSHSFAADNITSLDPRDTWVLSYDNSTSPAEGFVNQHTTGTREGYSGMYNLRGYKMHGGAGQVFNNKEYPPGTICPLDKL
jgi:hypothetical protein